MTGIEELKLIVEALSNLGEGAKTAFIVWVLIKYLFSSIIAWLGGVAIIYLICTTGKYVTRSFSLIGSICSLLELPVPEYDSQKRELLQYIKKLKELSKEVR